MTRSMTRGRFAWRLTGVLALSLVLFSIGACLHLGVLEREPGCTIFGDEGDGFFNLWVMQHVVGNLSRGDLNLADGRIFWPEGGRSYFWSDNLLAPSAIFAGCATLPGNLFDAFWRTGMVLALLGFLAYLALFGVLFRVVKSTHDGLPDAALWLAPVFAYLACFSRVRLIYFEHFQNLSALWVFTLAGGLIGYWVSKRRAYFAMAVAAEVLLLYSSPYFAVLGAGFILLWVIALALSGLRDLPAIVRANGLALVLGGGCFVPLLAGYALAEKVRYDAGIVRFYAIRYSDIWTPNGGPLRALLDGLVSLPAPEAERPAYLGLGLIVAVLALAVAQRRSIGQFMARVVKRGLFWCLLVGGAILLFASRGHGRFPCWMGLALIAFLLFLWVRYLARYGRADGFGFAAGFLGLCAVVTYGIALGPYEGCLGHRANPSIWGFCSMFLPGVANMRAVGRLAVVGQGFVLALVFLLLLRHIAGARHRLLVVGGAGLIFVQFVEQLDAKANWQRYDIRATTPAEDEAKWFNRASGPILAVPTNPFHRNAQFMLYFGGFPHLSLMNGYSAHSSTTWDAIMRLGQEREEGSEEQIQFAEGRGARCIVAAKGMMDGARTEELRRGPRRILFENDRLLVLERAPPP